LKKHRDADALAARITAAANQPAAILASPPKVDLEAETNAEPERATSKRKARLPDGDTVGISLRPHRTLLSRYVLKAADRTRQAGRVISAQEIMLEVLEHGA
jgi:hypothetical protein